MKVSEKANFIRDKITNFSRITGYNHKLLESLSSLDMNLLAEFATEYDEKKCKENAEVIREVSTQLKPFCFDCKQIQVLTELGVSLFDNQGELRKMSDILQDVSNVYHFMKNSKEEPPLLQIELENETAVPKVFYEGKEITRKVRVSLDWDTRKLKPDSGGARYNIEYADVVNGEPVQKGVGLARGKYLYDEQI